MVFDEQNVKLVFQCKSRVDVPEIKFLFVVNIGEILMLLNPILLHSSQLPNFLFMLGDLVKLLQLETARDLIIPIIVLNLSFVEEHLGSYGLELVLQVQEEVVYLGVS